MSDSDLGSYGPTTPHVKKKNTKSSQAKKNKAASKPSSSRSPEVLHVEDGPDIMSAEEGRSSSKSKRKATNMEEGDDDPTPPAKRKAAPLSKQARTTKPKGKGKGKTAEAADTQKPQTAEPNPITVDESEEDIQEDVEKPSPPAKKPSNSRATTSSTSEQKRIQELERRNGQLEHTVSRLTKELDAARSACEQLTKQFEELSRIRFTEPENLLQQLQEQYDVTVTAQDVLVDELKQRLSVVEPFKQLGNSRTLDYVRREDVDKGNQDLIERVKKYEGDLAAKDAQIRELQQLVAEKTLRVDLKNEVEHSKAIAAKAGKAGKQEGGAITNSDSKKYAASLRFYEDLTNLLIPNVKFHDSVIPDRRDTTFTCVYSAETADEDEPIPALNFTLKFCAELEEGSQPPVKHDTPFVEIITYTPLHLEQESEAFVGKLKFLGDAFSFKKEQLPLFLRELHKQLNPEDEGDEDDTKDTQNEEDVDSD